MQWTRVSFRNKSNLFLLGFEVSRYSRCPTITIDPVNL
jgi:hypothetical protein